MRRSIVRNVVFAAISLAALAAATAGTAQTTRPQRSTIAQSMNPPALPQSRMDGALIEFPLAEKSKAYASLNGRKMYKDVEELANIARHYRDTVHSRFWGRIIGTSGERETDAWLAAKFQKAGLSDVRIQPLDLKSTWFPKDWTVTVSGGGQTVELTSAQPAYRANALPNGGVELDAVYAGLGTEADFAGKDVKGKAVFVYSMLGAPNYDGVRRAGEKGAAAIFEVSMLPGNMRFQGYPSGTQAPKFDLGNDDGNAARKLIEAAANGAPVKVKANLSTEWVDGLKTALVWGVLPGMTDETIYIAAHKDGWFDASGDNASGVASMIALAEYYAKIPKSQRRRTLIFLGLDGHHNGGNDAYAGANYITQNRATLFKKNAMFLNIEHPSTVQTQSRPRYYPGDEIAWANTYMPLQWYAGGKTRPEMNRIAWDAFKEFGVSVMMDPSPHVPASDGSFFEAITNVVDAGEYHHYFHTDWETPETVPWTGLQATTRAFARIVDEVNKHPLSTFQRPEDTANMYLKHED